MMHMPSRRRTTALPFVLLLASLTAAPARLPAQGAAATSHDYTKADVDTNYVKLMKRLATFTQNGSGVFCGIATHDEAIIDTMRTFVREHNVAKSAFEFQMLYGIRRDLQRRLVAEGFGVRVYIPFGPEWYPYFMRRLAERPANLLFLAKNFFKN